MSDRYDEILSDWSSALDHWEESAKRLARVDTDYRARFNQKKKSIMDAGSSATAAETAVYADAQWSIDYLNLREAEVYVERRKKELALHEARFQAERSRNANTRGIR